MAQQIPINEIKIRAGKHDEEVVVPLTVSEVDAAIKKLKETGGANYSSLATANTYMAMFRLKGEEYVACRHCLLKNNGLSSMRFAFGLSTATNSTIRRHFKTFHNKSNKDGTPTLFDLHCAATNHKPRAGRVTAAPPAVGAPAVTPPPKPAKKGKPAAATNSFLPYKKRKVAPATVTSSQAPEAAGPSQAPAAAGPSPAESGRMKILADRFFDLYHLKGIEAKDFLKLPSILRSKHAVKTAGQLVDDNQKEKESLSKIRGHFDDLKKLFER